jgi:heavy metal translocating P-type ATPase
MNNSVVEQSCCDYCGLPLASGWWRRGSATANSSRSGTAEPQYCCSGCRLAAEIARQRGDAAPTALLTRLGFAIFLTINVVMVTMVLWSGDVYADGDSARNTTTSALAEMFRYLSLLFAWPVVWLLAGPLARNAWQQLRRGTPATDLLLVLGVGAAFIYSTVSVFRGTGHIYFEVGCVVLVFVTLGRWLETTGKQQANAALDALAKLLPNTVRRVVDSQEEIVSLEHVAPGDRLRLLPGERVPTDGRIVLGTAAIDEQLLTGESQPAIKELGDAVYGGTLNLDGQLTIEATAAACEGTLQRLVEAVAVARRTKGHYQRLADHIAAWFLPIAIAIALATFAWHTSRSGLEQGLLAAMAVVLIACPCALGLATPLAVWTAIGQAAQRQILFRHGDAIERLARVRAIFFDKTGTLSTGIAEVTEFAMDDGESAAAIHDLTRRIAQGSNHPLSIAVTDFVGPASSDEGQNRLEVRSFAGRGLLGVSQGKVLCSLGNLRWMEETSSTISPPMRALISQFERAGLALVCLGSKGHVRGVYVCSESLRPEGRNAIAKLRQLGLHVEMLSGDHTARANTIGAALDVPALGDLLPADKVAALRVAKGHWSAIAMVGDGVNDAPALAVADVGIAMGCGADVSREAADVCLLTSDLTHVAAAIELARRTVRVIRQNLFWAFAYNMVGIALACTGKLNPMWAAAAMTVSSVFVVSNSLRLASAWPNLEHEQAQPASEVPHKTSTFHSDFRIAKSDCLQ